VEELRARVTDTASELRERISPAAIKEDVKEYVRHTRENLMESVERRARENPLQTVAIAAAVAYPVVSIVRAIPVPILLIGAGIALSSRSKNTSHGAYASGGAWTGGSMGSSSMGSSSHGGMMDQARQTLGNSTETLKNTASEWTDKASQAAASAQDSMRHAGNQMRTAGQQVSDAASRAASSAAESVQSAASTVRDTMSSATDSLRQMGSTAASTVSSAPGAVADVASAGYQSAADAAAYARDQVGYASRRARDTASDVVERYPLLVAGIGLAIGGILAAALPVTRAESRYLGSAADELKERARDMASQGFEQAKASAQQLYEETARKAQEQGLSADALRQAGEDIRDKAPTVMERTTGSGSEQQASGSTQQGSGSNQQGGTSTAGQPGHMAYQDSSGFGRT
jgi:ElaB/YqjD/DUF883 family membrane-anchored ribosome-binding protein